MRFNHYGVIGELTTLPGCSQIVVSHNVFTPSQNRNKGLGTLAHKERLKVMRQLGYDYGLCTVAMENTAQRAILEKEGWSRLDLFSSSKTQHLVGLYGRCLDDVVCTTKENAHE